MERKTIITGLLIFANGLVTGHLFSPNPREVSILEDKIESLSSAYQQCVTEKQDFVSSMPNYDPMGLWLNTSYQDWMIKDIQENYKK